MRKYIIISAILIIIILGFLAGLYIFKITTLKEELKDLQIAKVETIEDECTAEYEYMNQIKTTNAQNEKISPNAKLITYIYYKECGHVITKTSIIEDKYINSTQEELQEAYKGWEIRAFSKDEIELYKEEEGICKEHYVVKEKDGYIAIYSLDENENEILYEMTEIPTQFLPTTDLEELQSGIRAYGKESLYSLLEDFE